MSYCVSMEEVLPISAWLAGQGIAGAGRDEPTMIPIGEASLGSSGKKPLNTVVYGLGPLTVIRSNCTMSDEFRGP
jgi:hypothetical protein